MTARLPPRRVERLRQRLPIRDFFTALRGARPETKLSRERYDALAGIYREDLTVAGEIIGCSLEQWLTWPGTSPHEDKNEAGQPAAR